MIQTIIVFLVILWMLGLIVGIGGNLIHLLIVVAVVMYVFNLLSGHKRVV